MTGQMAESNPAGPRDVGVSGPCLAERASLTGSLCYLHAGKASEGGNGRDPKTCRDSWPPTWSAIRGLPAPTRTGARRGFGRSAATWSIRHRGPPGRIVKRTGDGSLIEFRSVVDAVRCAIEVQSAMVERNAGVPRGPPHRLSHRHSSRRRRRGGRRRLMGDGVLAARLESIAQPGAICLSEDAYRQVKSRLDP